MEAILKTTQLTKRYLHGNAVDVVSLTVRRGDIYGFIGENGAGKTTLMRMVASLIAPTSGDIALFGASDTEGLHQARKRMGSIIEGPAFYPNLTARQNLEYYRILRGIPEKNAVDNALETVRLTDTGRKKYKVFSLGMKQRLALANAIMGKPDFLMLDEPINGLDPIGIVDFRSIIQDLVKRHGMTILISSHILSELYQVATTFGIIHQGRLIREFSQQQLADETKHCLAVRVSDSAAAAVVMEEVLHITNFEVLPQGELRVYEGLDNPAEITFQLATNGVRVLSVNELGVSLEDYFMTAIGQRKGGR